MTTAGDIMHRGAQWIPAHETLDRAAQLMRELGVGALPISDENERLCGILTDRDIVIGCVAVGHDPARVTAGEMAQGTPRWIDASADVDDVLHEMREHQIRRLPVVEIASATARVDLGVGAEGVIGRRPAGGQVLRVPGAVTEPSAGAGPASPGARAGRDGSTHRRRFGSGGRPTGVSPTPAVSRPPAPPPAPPPGTPAPPRPPARSP